jgi:hypothetical protein
MRKYLTVCAAFAGLFAAAGSARAHGEYQWIQDRDTRTGDACCGEHDCFKVQVTYANGAYLFKLDGMDFSVPYSQAKTSEDGQYWACRPRPGMLRCFFAPPQST